MNTNKTIDRFAVGAAFAAALILVRLGLGVGGVGRDGDPADLTYFGALALGIIGTLVLRFGWYYITRVRIRARHN